jgi:hypothetical protein
VRTQANLAAKCMGDRSARAASRMVKLFQTHGQKNKPPNNHIPR